MTNVYHCDEYRHVLVDPDLLAHQLHRGVGLVCGLDLEMLLDCLNLLGHGGQSSLLESVKLVKASPGSHLTQTDEDPSHGLEVKSLVTVEDEDKSAKLVSKSLDSLSFSGSRWAKW